MEPEQNSQPNQTIPPHQAGEPSPQKNNTFIYVIVLALLVLVGGLLYFTLGNNTQNTSQAPRQNVSTAPSPIPTAASPVTDEQEAEAIDVSDPAPTEFVEVEKDIKNL